MGTVTKSGVQNVTTDIALADGASIIAKTVVGGLKTVVATPTAAGTGYTAGDILDVILAGYATGGKVKVKTVSSGQVTALETVPVNAGSGYIVLAGYATTGGTGEDCTVEISAIVPDPHPVTVHKITCGLIANTGGAQCGYVTLRDGAVELWSGYVSGVVNAAGEAVHQSFDLGVVFTPVTNLMVVYTAKINATTAAVSMVWSA